MKNKNNWDGWEEIFLMNNYLFMSIDKMGKTLGRTNKSIARKLEEMGLVKMQRWTPEEEQIIIINSHLKPRDLVKLLPGRTKDAVSYKKRVLLGKN